MAFASLRETDRADLRRRWPGVARRIEALLEQGPQVREALSLADTAANLVLLLVLLPSVFWFAEQKGTSVWWIFALALLFVFFLVEALPKRLGAARPCGVLGVLGTFAEAVARFFERPARWLWALRERVAKLHGAGVEPLEAAVAEREELRVLLDCAVAEGNITAAEGRLLAACVKLGVERAMHCMTPRVDVFGIPDDLSNEEAATLLRARRYHRVPVHGDSPDDIVGILDVFKFFREALSREAMPHYTEMLQPPAFVPAMMNALALLESFLVRNQRMAILLDEYGGVEGIVTLSDLLEELIGVEGPEASGGLYIEKIRPDLFLVAGHARLDDLVEMMGCEFPESAADTIGGLIAEMHGGLPRAGTRLEIGNWEATVRRASRKRVKEVQLERKSES